MSEKNKYNIDCDISKARTLNADYYTSDRIFNSSVNSIFTKSWQLVCHKNELEDSNIIPVKFLPDFISEPLVITKQNESIYCVSNVCTHRGHIVCSKKNLGKSLVCRYHGRSFHLDGKFKNTIGFDRVKNFPSKKDNLRPMKVKEWKDFIFVSLNDKLDISNVLSDIGDRVKLFPFNKIKYSKELSSTYKIDAHWALYCENYLEGFHIPFVHKGLFKEINNESYSTILLDGGVLQLADSNDNPNNIYGYYYWIFPNLMLNFYNWGLSINIIEPISKNQTRVRFLSYPIEDNKSTRDAINDLKTVELEDQRVVKSVQEGIKSRYYSAGRYSAEHETGVHYFHSLLSHFI